MEKLKNREITEENKMEILDEMYENYIELMPPRLKWAWINFVCIFMQMIGCHLPADTLVEHKKIALEELEKMEIALKDFSLIPFEEREKLRKELEENPPELLETEEEKALGDKILSYYDEYLKDMPNGLITDWKVYTLSIMQMYLYPLPEDAMEHHVKLATERLDRLKQAVEDAEKFGYEILAKDKEKEEKMNEKTKENDETKKVVENNKKEN